MTCHKSGKRSIRNPGKRKCASPGVLPAKRRNVPPRHTAVAPDTMKSVGRKSPTISCNSGSATNASGRPSGHGVDSLSRPAKTSSSACSSSLCRVRCISTPRASSCSRAPTASRSSPTRRPRASTRTCDWHPPRLPHRHPALHHDRRQCLMLSRIPHARSCAQARDPDHEASS